MSWAQEFLEGTDKMSYMCHTPNPGLSMNLRDNNYDDFIKYMNAEIKAKHGTSEQLNIKIDIKCEGQCPEGCQKKFHINKLKSISKKTFARMHKHGLKYPEHCFIVKFDYDFKMEKEDGPIL